MPVDPIITDRITGKELWLAADCAHHCNVTVSTWRSYSRKDGNMNPPTPVAYLTKQTAVWDAEEVKTWHANRPGSPGRPPATKFTARLENYGYLHTCARPCRRRLFQRTSMGASAHRRYCSHSTCRRVSHTHQEMARTMTPIIIDKDAGPNYG